MSRSVLPRLCLALYFAGIVSFAGAQKRIVSFGVYSGVTSTYTWDEGINLDSRYNARYDIKLAPIGFSYGLDYDRFGFMINPGIITTGQNFYVINTIGIHEGVRKINLRYLNLPVTFKFHLIDLTFMKTSFIFGASAGYLLKGRETITHDNAKLKFPTAVLPILPPSYVPEPDGVLAPEVQKLEMVTHNDFKKFQFFGAIGIRAEWYLSERWRASFDFSANYTIFDNRTDTYLEKLNAYQTMYDLPGKRRDIIGMVTLGLSRYMEVQKKEAKATRKKSKESGKQFKPGRQPRPGSKKSKAKY